MTSRLPRLRLNTSEAARRIGMDPAVVQDFRRRYHQGAFDWIIPKEFNAPELAWLHTAFQISQSGVKHQWKHGFSFADKLHRHVLYWALIRKGMGPEDAKREAKVEHPKQWAIGRIGDLVLTDDIEWYYTADPRTAAQRQARWGATCYRIAIRKIGEDFADKAALI